MSYWQEAGQFLGELRRDFFHTGAVLPSSRFLARAMTVPLRQPRGPARILEVGPGTGAVTGAILASMGAEDHLEVVEINERFVERLRDRFVNEEFFRRLAPQVSIRHAAIQDVPGEAAYDFVISGLPMNNFPAGMVREIFRTFRRLLRPGGTLTYFEYVLIRQLKTPVVGRTERRRLSQVGRIVRRYVGRCQVDRALVLANVPPAFVRHLVLHPSPKTHPP